MSPLPVPDPIPLRRRAGKYSVGVVGAGGVLSCTNSCALPPSSMLRRIKARLRRYRLRRHGIAVEDVRRTAVYGGGGGAWELSPEAVPRGAIVYSFGAGRDISFDLAIHERHDATVHIFDPTPASIDWMRSCELPPGVRFHEVGIAGYDGEFDFHLPPRPGSANFSAVPRRAGTGTARAPVRRLRTLMDSLAHERVDVLKMDIEGGEYGVIADLSVNPPPVTQLLVEFHHNFPGVSFARTVEAVQALRSIGFRVIAISERTYEISMLRTADTGGGHPV